MSSEICLSRDLQCFKDYSIDKSANLAMFLNVHNGQLVLGAQENIEFPWKKQEKIRETVRTLKIGIERGIKGCTAKEKEGIERSYGTQIEILRRCDRRLNNVFDRVKFLESVYTDFD